MSGKLRPYEPLLMTLLRFGDAFLGVSYFLGLSWIYNMYNPNYLMVGNLIFFITMICFHVVGLYSSWRVTSLRYEIHQIILGCISVVILMLLVGYALKVSHLFSRRVALTWMITWPIIMWGERLVIRAILRYYRKKGHNIRKAVIAGAGDLGDRLAHWVDKNPWSGTKVIGFFDDNGAKPQKKEYHVLGTLNDLPSYVRSHSVDMIYIALPMRDESKIEWLLAELSDSTASVCLIPDIFLFDLLLGSNLTYIDNIPVITLRDTPLLGFNALLKRLEDLLLASMALLLVSPLMLAVTIGIKLTSRGPVFFRQWRYGIDGRPITVYKFRTMNVCEDGYSFKQATECDPRVTALGALLRRMSLDELPQLINVIQGRMSIVGPRPHPVAMNEEFRKLVPGYMLRHKVRPGITGLAQVNGWRGETDTLEKMEKRIEYDLEYLRQWSLYLDFKIIFETLWNGSLRMNAY
jgi:putative colanic acid biosynthesis UDP-glucose lipid carrier transferase